MSAQRARSAVVAGHRSAHPGFPGVPGWGAVLVAITATAIGFAFDAGSGSKELSWVFAACYLLSCLAAVLAVRQDAVFTAVIQPPLILFVSVPGAYFLFTGGQFTGLKDLAINCGYPLIERFPLMFFTSAAVLLIGMVRWYIGMSTRRTSPQAAEAPSVSEPGRVAELATALMSKGTAKVSALLARKSPDDAEDVAPPRSRRAEGASRSTRTSRAASNRSGRPGSRTSTPRPRHVRPPETEVIGPVAERPRRTRSGKQPEPPSPAQPRRSARASNPRQPGPAPSERRVGFDRTARDRTAERPERRRRLDDYQPREPHRSNGNGTHHPVSRVRYRGEENDDRSEYRTRRRTPRDWEADSWEYDI